MSGNGGHVEFGSAEITNRGPVTGHRSALVTGASRGLGAAIAAKLAPDHTVWLGGRDTAALRRQAATLPNARVWAVDLTDRDMLSRAVKGIERLDVLVHNAAIIDLAPIADTPAQTWRRLFEVNVIAVAELTRLLLPALRTAHGRVIIVNSTAAFHVAAHRAAYTASKQALRAFTDTLRAEESAQGVSVTSIFPGRIATDMQKQVCRMEGQPFHPERYLSPDAVAAVVRTVVDAPPGTDIPDLTVRPRPTRAAIADPEQRERLVAKRLSTGIRR